MQKRRDILCSSVCEELGLAAGCFNAVDNVWQNLHYVVMLLGLDAAVVREVLATRGRYLKVFYRITVATVTF